MENGQGFRRGQGFKHGQGFGRGASDIQNPVRRYEMEDGDNVEALKKQYQAAQEMVTAIENEIKSLGTSPRGRYGGNTVEKRYRNTQVLSASL